MLCIQARQLQTENSQHLGIYLLTEWVVGAGILLLHRAADGENTIQLLRSEHHTGVFTHHQVDRACRRDVQITQEVGSNTQSVALEALASLEALNDSAGEGNAQRTWRKMILVLIDDNISLALQTDKDTSTTKDTRHIIVVDDDIVLLAVDICKEGIAVCCFLLLQLLFRHISTYYI